MKRAAVILSILMIVSSSAWAGAGKTGAEFLKLGGGARALGMGEAYVALADDSTSVFWNPAGLAKMNFPDLTYMYNQWFLDIKHQYLNFAFPTVNGTFGGSYSLLDSGDIQGYDSTGALTSTFKTSSSALTFSWGRRINQRLSFGLCLKTISESLENRSASSTAADLGVLFDVNPRFSLGAAIQNVGTPLKFVTEDTPLPQSMRAGAALRSRIFNNDLNLAADLVSYADGTSALNVGTEYWLQDLLALRLGSARGHLRSGVGVVVSNFSLDYAYLSRDDLGTAHQVSVTYSFGTEDKKKALVLEYLTQAKAYYDKGRFAESVVELEKALRLDPENAEARALLTKATRALETGAVEEVKEEIRSEKEAEANKYIDAGKKFMEEKQYLEAITEFNKALRIIPSHPEAVKLMREAQSALEAEVTEKVKEEAREHLGLALKYITTQDYPAAMKEVEEVLKIDPGNVQALKLYRKLKTIIELEKK